MFLCWKLVFHIERKHTNVSMLEACIHIERKHIGWPRPLVVHLNKIVIFLDCLYVQGRE